MTIEQKQKRDKYLADARERLAKLSEDDGGRPALVKMIKAIEDKIAQEEAQANAQANAAPVGGENKELDNFINQPPPAAEKQVAAKLAKQEKAATKSGKGGRKKLSENAVKTEKVLSEKNSPKISPVEKPAVVAEKKQMVANADVISKQELKKLQPVKIGCTLYAKVHSGEPQTVKIAVGTEKAFDGDVILYLEDGHPFTVIRQEDISKRCIKIEGSDTYLVKQDNDTYVVSNDEKGVVNVDLVSNDDGMGDMPMPKNKPEADPIDAEIKDMNKTNDDVILDTKTAQKVKAESKKVAQKAKKEKVNLMKVADSLIGTPIDTWLRQKVEDYKQKRTSKYIVRVVLLKEPKDNGEGETCNFYAKVKERSVVGILFKSERWYSVCADSGKAKLMPENFKPSPVKYLKDFNEEAMKAMYRGDIYNECKTIARELYAFRKENTKAVREKDAAYKAKMERYSTMCLAAYRSISGYGTYVEKYWEEIRALRKPNEKGEKLTVKEATAILQTNWREQYANAIMEL